MKKLIKKKDFARLMGVSKGRVSQWLKAGVIREVDGRLDIEKAVEGVMGYRSRGLRKPERSLIDLKIDLTGLVK